MIDLTSAHEARTANAAQPARSAICSRVADPGRLPWKAALEGHLLEDEADRQCFAGAGPQRDPRPDQERPQNGGPGRGRDNQSRLPVFAVIGIEPVFTDEQ